MDVITDVKFARWENFAAGLARRLTLGRGSSRATDLERWHGPGAVLELPDHAARPDRITSGSGDLLDTYSRFSSMPSRREVLPSRKG